METNDYLHSSAFQNKVNDLNHFLQTHPHLLILELGVSARSDWLRPLLHQILMQNSRAFCIELNQNPNPIPKAYSGRVMQISGSLDSSLDTIKNLIKEE